jgi:hypothetical protein
MDQATNQGATTPVHSNKKSQKKTPGRLRIQNEDSIHRRLDQEKATKMENQRGRTRSVHWKPSRKMKQHRSTSSKSKPRKMML